MTNNKTEHNVLIGLGSNLGDKEENITKGIQYIESSIGKVEAVSSLYHTSPVGFESANSFLNAACLVKTNLYPIEVLHITQQIEKNMGRSTKSTNRIYSDRIIDIDILFYDNEIINSPELVVPHPFLHIRNFVLQPLVEIAPDYIHPVLKKSISVLNSELNTANRNTN